MIGKDFSQEESSGLRFGFINKAGKIVIQAQYLDAYSFTEGLAKVRLNEKEGFIDKTGKTIIQFLYDNSSEEGEEICECDIDNFGNSQGFKEGLAVMTRAGKKGVINRMGKQITPFKYDEIHQFTKGIATVKIGDWETGKWGIIDVSGKEIVPLQYNQLYPLFFGDLIGAKSNGKYGFIDKMGREVIPFRYSDANSFSEGLSKVELDGKRMLIDRTGREVRIFEYDKVESFSEGLATVRFYGGKSGVVDKLGREVIAVKYDSIWCNAFIKEGFIGVYLNGKKGFVDIYGNEYFDF